MNRTSPRRRKTKDAESCKPGYTLRCAGSACAVTFAGVQGTVAACATGCFLSRRGAANRAEATAKTQGASQHEHAANVLYSNLQRTCTLQKTYV